jgi:hypothetical protein
MRVLWNKVGANLPAGVYGLSARSAVSVTIISVSSAHYMKISVCSQQCKPVLIKIFATNRLFIQVQGVCF